MSNFENLKRKIIHGLIVKYLVKCGGAFHQGAYGESGRYVRLFTDEEYGRFQNSKF